MPNNNPLQANPILNYNELIENKYSLALHHEAMQYDSAYNTYRHPGLPPGSIGNPGRTSLEAAMHPAQSDFYYFVSDGNGHHRFANSLEEHNRNVSKLRKAIAGR